MKDETFRLSLIIEAASPVILLPVSSDSTDLLICDLGQLSISNKFKESNEVGTISVEVDNPTGKVSISTISNRFKLIVDISLQIRNVY